MNYTEDPATDLSYMIEMYRIHNMKRDSSYTRHFFFFVFFCVVDIRVSKTSTTARILARPPRIARPRIARLGLKGFTPFNRVGRMCFYNSTIPKAYNNEKRLKCSYIPSFPLILTTLWYYTFLLICHHYYLRRQGMLHSWRSVLTENSNVRTRNFVECM